MDRQEVKMTLRHALPDLSPVAGPRLRAGIAALPVYRPGARGGAGRPVTRLASNESPYPPLPGVLDAVAAAAAEANRYPDLTCGPLVEALAERYRVPARQVVVGTGSSALLLQLAVSTSGPGDEVVYAWRSFESYPIVTGVAGARGVPVPLDRQERHDLAAMAAAITDRTRLVLLCSPNNPTGTMLTADQVRAFLHRVPPDVLVVLDEAYAEFVRDPASVVGPALLAEFTNLVVLRTFSKAFGLAGLRVGYALAPVAVADALRATAVPFGVSTVAQAAALVSLGVTDRLAERVDAVVDERGRVATELRGQGWPTLEGGANFVWLPLRHRAEDFAAACAEAGVLVRPYPDDGVRITIGTPAENDTLLATTATLTP
jgi:histidinol-phosphate aminotransferase